RQVRGHAIALEELGEVGCLSLGHSYPLSPRNDVASGHLSGEAAVKRMIARRPAPSKRSPSHCPGDRAHKMRGKSRGSMCRLRMAKLPALGHTEEQDAERHGGKALSWIVRTGGHR